MNYSREYLGSVLVSEGVIQIGDPWASEDEDMEAIARAKTPEGFGISNLSITVGTVFVEGRHSVYGTRNESGELISVEIILDEVEPPTDEN